ncbi:hypothetical protein M0G74_17580 [Microbulbifer sp. CAU 1566]|uniref:hypothetical protein n=1 Tax=Microbulbifer sp. CAU 1566 TaxID=2933269 RepID=UPI002004660B|nr:hypothetical protein [Microbulbifer sp. CAU 1566]MCK7599089.1 hypothetical protein [Microbulbifer sp. CAU 1566]
MEMDWMNLGAGFLTGVASSLLVSKYFQWKNRNELNRSKFHGYNTEKTLLSVKYPSFFMASSAKRIGFSETPANSDVPRLSEIIFSSYPLERGQRCEALLRVSDEQWNFPMKDGIEASFLGKPVSINNEDFGFMKLAFDVPAYAKKAIYHIECQLRDEAGNVNSQSIPLEIA